MGELLDALGEMLGMAMLVGGVVIGLPAFGLGFVAGRLSKRGAETAPKELGS